MRKLFLIAVLAVTMAVQGQENGHHVKCGENCSKHKTCCDNQLCCKDTTSQMQVYNEKKEVDCLDFDVALGWNLMTDMPDGVKGRFFGSRELTIGIRYEYTPKQALQTYSVGLWAKWSRYALDEKAFKIDNGVVGVTDFPAGATSTYSHISIFSLSVPFFFTQKFGHQSDWSVTLGPVLNFNLRGRVNNEYDKGDDNIDISTKGLEYRPFTVDLMGMLTYKKVSVFAKYSPMTVLKKDRGPQFHSVTLGVFL